MEFSTGFVVWIVGFSTDEDGAHDGEKFTHEGAEGDFRGFAFLDKFGIDALEIALASNGGDGGEVERLAHSWVALFTHAGAFGYARTRLDDARAYAGKCCELAGALEAAEIAQFGKDND